jgi:hypothetical protein
MSSLVRPALRPRSPYDCLKSDESDREVPFPALHCKSRVNYKLHYNLSDVLNRLVGMVDPREAQSLRQEVTSCAGGHKTAV